jgi:hypothetical protein
MPAFVSASLNCVRRSEAFPVSAPFSQASRAFLSLPRKSTSVLRVHAEDGGCLGLRALDLGEARHLEASTRSLSESAPVAPQVKAVHNSN